MFFPNSRRVSAACGSVLRHVSIVCFSVSCRVSVITSSVSSLKPRQFTYIPCSLTSPEKRLHTCIGAPLNPALLQPYLRTGRARADPFFRPSAATAPVFFECASAPSPCAICDTHVQLHGLCAGPDQAQFCLRERSWRLRLCPCTSFACTLLRWRHPHKLLGASGSALRWRSAIQRRGHEHGALGCHSRARPPRRGVAPLRRARRVGWSRAKVVLGQHGNLGRRPLAQPGHGHVH